MNVDAHVSGISGAIGEPALRQRQSVHLNRLKAEHLIKVYVQGKHRYYSLEGPNLAERWPAAFATSSCQTHLAGCLPRGPATVTWPAHWARRPTTAAWRCGVCQSFRRAATMHTTQ